jgi:hypothetical protein
MRRVLYDELQSHLKQNQAAAQLEGRLKIFEAEPHAQVERSQAL